MRSVGVTCGRPPGLDGARIWVGNDHGGYELKLHLMEYLRGKGVAAHDVGCDSTEIVRYPYHAAQVAEAILRSAARDPHLLDRNRHEHHCQ